MELQQLLTSVGDVVRGRLVYGEAVERDGVTVIPAARVRAGGGGGIGAGDQGAGGGGGLVATPAGAWVIRGDDVVWQPAADPLRAAQAAAFAIVGAAVAVRTLRKRT